MRISAKTDYAVRAATEFAAAYADGKWLKAETVAEAQQIPLPFLLNILAELREHGLTESKRGVDGGYRLARSPAKITVADVIRAIDGPLANIAGQLVEDVEYAGNAAALRDTWVALRVSMRKVLEKVTLADLTRGSLPGSVRRLCDGEGAWVTRADAVATHESR
jgi:Rrf2 family protein